MSVRGSGLVPVLVATLMAVAAPAAARSHGHGSSHHGHPPHGHSSYSHAYHGGVHHATHASPGVQRDTHGRIKRSQEAKRAFLRQHGLSHVPKGYEVDHRTPLCAGGDDDPSNMQLLTKSQHRAKTRGDVKACRRR